VPWLTAWEKCCFLVLDATLGVFWREPQLERAWLEIAEVLSFVLGLLVMGDDLLLSPLGGLLSYTSEQ
jgi:hypothetical protein